LSGGLVNVSTAHQVGLPSSADWGNAILHNRCKAQSVSVGDDAGRFSISVKMLGAERSCQSLLPQTRLAVFLSNLQGSGQKMTERIFAGLE
jgi:hypothetical protein